jgi:hypothetical protein
VKVGAEVGYELRNVGMSAITARFNEDKKRTELILLKARLFLIADIGGEDFTGRKRL